MQLPMEMPSWLQTSGSPETMKHDSEPCLKKPCQNDGECIQDLNKPMGFICRCPKDFTGSLCADSQYTYIVISMQCLNIARGNSFENVPAQMRFSLFICFYHSHH